MTNGIVKLLGELVEGVLSIDGLTTSWTVVGGPYKAIIVEWTFEDKKHYRYELRVHNAPYLPSSSTRSTDTIEEAIEKVESALRDYLVAKAVIEKRFGPEVVPNTLLEYKVRSSQSSSE